MSNLGDRMRRASEGLNSAVHSVEVPPMEDVQKHARQRTVVRSAGAMLIVLVVAAGAAFAVGRRTTADKPDVQQAPVVGPFVLDQNNPQNPQNKDAHWHAALGVYDCDHWVGDGSGAGVWNWPAATPQGSPARVGEPNVYAGLHSHDDGVIHMEPTTADDAGANATLGRYFDEGGWKVSSTGFDFLGVSKHNGDSCPNAQTSRFMFIVNGKAVSGDPAQYKLNNNDRIVLAFADDPAKFSTVPPSAKNLPDSASYGSATAKLKISIAPGGQLKFVPSSLSTTTGYTTLEITGTPGHTLVFDDPAVTTDPAQIATDRPGATTQVATVFFPKAGDYSFFCGVPGHREAGERGVFHVTGPDQPAIAPPAMP